MTEPQRVTIYSAAYDRSPGASHRLLRRAAQLYAPGLAEPVLASGAHGKPYFPDAPQLQFSISHSGAYWLCAFSAAPVGVYLLQEIRNLSGTQFRWNTPKTGERWMIDLYEGGSELRQGKTAGAELLGRWSREAADFQKRTEKVRLYR